MKLSNLSSSSTSQLAIIFHKNISILSFLLAFTSQNMVYRVKTGDWRSNAEQQSRTRYQCVLHCFAVLIFSIKPRKQWDISIYLAMSWRTVLLCDLNWKIIRENAMCVKLSLYFFYKNIVYQYLFAYIDIAWLHDIK